MHAFAISPEARRTYSVTYTDFEYQFVPLEANTNSSRLHKGLTIEKYTDGGTQG